MTTEPKAGPNPESRGTVRSRSPLDLLPAVVVPAVAAAGVVLAWPFVRVTPALETTLPLWAVEAFGPDLIGSALAASTLPPPVLLAYGLLPLAVPAVGGLLGLGTVARWASLAAFCLMAAVLLGLLLVGLLLHLIAPASPGFEAGVGLIVGLAAPLLALQCCGCLLAASLAPSSRLSDPAAVAGCADCRRHRGRLWLECSLRGSGARPAHPVPTVAERILQQE